MHSWPFAWDSQPTAEEEHVHLPGFDQEQVPVDWVRPTGMAVVTSDMSTPMGGATGIEPAMPGPKPGDLPLVDAPVRVAPSDCAEGERD